MTDGASKHPNEALIDEFYEAFAAYDGEKMGACYADDASFSDPVFTDLDASGVRAMWAMLTDAPKDLKVEHSNVQADDERGTAHWEAWYTFPPGREVHNIIEAKFEFRDGKIVRHQDTFDFYRWTRMALGPAGAVLGWTPFVQNGVRKKAAARLAKFRSRRG